MNAEFIMILKSHKWLKWFCCPHCGSSFAISENGRCNACDEYLVLIKDRTFKFESDIANDIMENDSNSLMPWELGSSFYYYSQWIQWDAPGIDIDIS